MEILDLRHFASADLRPLLEEEIDMWGRLLSWDYTVSAEMILRYMDAKILPGYAAIERGSIFGYSFFVLPVLKASAQGVHQKHRAAAAVSTRRFPGPAHRG